MRDSSFIVAGSKVWIASSVETNRCVREAEALAKDLLWSAIFLSTVMPVRTIICPPAPIKTLRPSASRVGVAKISGNPPTGPAFGRFSVRFYMTAILFILFDVEVVFLYPWAILFRDLGMFGFVEMLTFLLVLGIGLLYAWRKGALEWD